MCMEDACMKHHPMRITIDSIVLVNSNAMESERQLIEREMFMKRMSVINIVGNPHPK